MEQKNCLWGTCRFHGKVMNRIYKVIFNRSLGLYQVVSEIARNHGRSSSHAERGRKSLLVPFVLSALLGLGLTGSVLAEGTGTADTQTNSATVANGTVLAGDGAVTVKSDTTSGTNTVTIFVSKDGKVESENTDLVTGGTVNTAINTAVNAEQTARSSADTALNNKIDTLDANGSYIQKDDSVSSNLSKLDTQVKANADAISTEKTDREAAVTTLSDSAVKYDTDSSKGKVTLAGEGGTTITNVKDGDLSDSSTDAVTGKQLYAEQTAREAAIGTLDANGNYIQKDASVSSNLSTLDKQVKTNADAITNNASEISTEVKNRTNADTALSDKIGTLDANGNYIQKVGSVSSNLSTLDNTLKTFADQLGVDLSSNTNLANQLYKYYKVNPEITTNADNTKTYVPDAAANGTNSVAIGPSAQAGDKSTDATTSTTTITGGKSSTAIGDSAKANGDQSVALGYGSEVLNTTDQSGKTTATISGSTAIGKGAKVNGATDAAAVGTSAQVNETATGGIAFGKNAVTGEDKGTVTVGDVTADVAAVGGENSVALGTSAKASGNTALALGKGAQVNNYTTQSGTTVTKTVNSGSTAIGNGATVTGANDAVALGSGASITGTGTNADDSMSIGKSATVATAKDAMALGTSASVASGADNAIAIGNTAKANTSNTTAIGYNATATGAGAVAIGENTSTSTEGGISIGSGTSVSGRSIAIGYSTDGVTTGSDNTDAVAIGNGAQAYANDSISIGHQAGKGTNEGRTSGYGSLIAIGTNAGGNVKGMQNVALGSGAGSNVKSSYNVAIGSNAGAGINYAAATDSNPQDGYNVSIGYEANYQSADANAKNIKESIAIGHSANAVSEATALGTGAAASGDKSMALGYNATAADTDSIALGDKASAGGGNIAIGSGSQAPAVASYDKGYLTGSTFVNGYISIGGKTSATGTTVLRRISNVADGAADQDVVTVAQLKAAYTNLEGTIKTTDNKISDTYTQSAIDSKISTVESKITASQTKYFSINPSGDTLTANVNNDGASTSGAADAMAIGPNATATSAKAVAIGNNVSASGKGSIALGTADNPATTGTVDAGNNTSANPHVTSAEGANSVAVGTSAIAQTDNSVALGTRASVYTSNVTDPATNTTVKVGQQSIAIGYQAETRNSNATSIGSDAKAYSNGSTAIGNSAYAQGADSVVIGTSSTAYGADSGIVGKSNTINGSNTYAVGSENNVNGNWGAVTYSGLYGSKNTVNPVSDASGNTKHGMDSLSVTGNSNTISQGSYSDTVQNISILGNSNSVTGASGDEANAGTTANITVIGGNNEVTGRDGAGSDYMGKTWNQLTRTTVIGYGNTVNQATATTSLADTQILGNDVTATLGNSVYLGTGAAAKNANVADSTTLTNAETAAVDALDTTGMTDTDKAMAQAEAKEKARYATNLAAMKKSGTTAGLQTLNTDTTYDDGTSYTYAGSSPAGVVTVGNVGAERRIQNVAAGLVSATSTDAVNGSQLYALTRQLRFGGDNSSFGTTTADDKNVVARGSNETIAITGGSDAVTSSTTDGNTTYTVDTTKLTDNNIAVVADTDKEALHVQLASSLKDLNTAQLGSGSGDSYKETIRLDGTGTNGGQMTLAGADGTVKTTIDTTGLTVANGPKFTSSGIDAASQKITSVKAGEADTDAANVGQVKAAAAEATTEVKAGTNASLGTVDTNAADKHKIYTVNVDNLAVKANGTGTTTVALANGINFKNGTNTTSDVDSNGNVTIDTKNLTLKANGTNTATVTMDNGINFKNGTNTTATVGTDGTITIEATHNKLDSTSYTASKPSDSSNRTTIKLKDTDGNETTLNLTDTYTTVSKNTDHTITFKRNDGSNLVSVSLDDLNGASKKALTTAVAKATTTVIKGNNVDSVDDDTTSADGHHIYKVNVSNLGVKVADGQKKSVALSEGLVFGNGTNTTASVGDNGAITFNVSDAAIKTKAKDAIDVVKGNDNVTVDTTTSTDGTKKTFTISAKDTYTTVTKDADKKTVTFTRNDGTTPATTLSLSDFGAASTTDMTVAAAKATTEVRAGTNATLGTVETDQTDQHKIYTVNVDNLALKQNGTTVGTGTGVSLKNGLNFSNGTNTTANVTENGTVSYGVSNDAIKAQAKDAVVVAAGDNVSIDTPMDANNVKTYTVKVNDLKLQANGEDKGTRKLAEGINFADGKNTTATVEDGKVIYNLNDTLTGLTSMTAKDTAGNQTLVSGSGVTITPAAAGAQSISLTTNGLSMGGQQITDVESGGDTDTNAANISDVKRLVQASASGTTETGFNVKGDDATAKKVKLGKQLNVVGGTNDTSKLSDGNIGVVTTDDGQGNATLTVKLNKNINLDSVKIDNTTLDTNGLTISGGPKIVASGIDAGNKVISGVANGSNDTDAVNISQLKAVQSDINAGWTIKGKDSANVDVNANIGKGKSVTYSNGNYTKAVITKDDSGNAAVTVDVTTGTLTTGTDGKITSADGLATTGDVASAVNGASWTIQDGNNTGNAQQVKAGDTVSLKAGDNLSLDQDGKKFTYKLNKTLENMTSVTAVDDKQNTAVLNGEGLKVSDKEGDSLTQHATEVRLHSATAATEDTSKDVVLNNAGLTVGNNVKFTNNGISAGDQKITGVADGEVQTGSKEAVNGGQLYELQQKVTNGWKITGNDTTKASNIGNDKTVSFVNGDNGYIKSKVDTTNTGATVSYTAQTASLTTTDGKAELTGTMDGLVTGRNLTSVLNNLSWTAQSSKVGSGQNSGSTSQSIAAGSKVSFIAGDNMILTQDGMNFTYALNSSLTGMNTIAFTGLGNGASNLTIGLQNGGGANSDKGYYITGLSNTKWDQSNYEGTRAATEAQLREAIDKVSAATGTGGFGLTADEGANNGGEKKVSQTLGRTIAIQGDGTYDAEGKVVKPGNISTVAYTDNAGPTGAIKVKLNKDIDLSEAGSLTIGASKVSAGSIVLDNTGDAAKKIALNSTAGTASIGGVTVNGAAKTVMGLANTTWDGKAVSGRAATEDQLAKAISDVSEQATNSELHIRKGTYGVGKDKDGQDVADPKGKNSVSIDVVNATGTVDGQVVINDVAKASELGAVGGLAANLKNPAGGPTTVVQAVNNVNQKVDDSLKQVNGDITNAVTEAKKHTEVKSVDSDNNVTIDGTTTNAAGGTVYKLGLNKDHLNLGNVHIYGNEGRVTAKTVEAEMVKIDDQTRLDQTGLTTGNTTVTNNRIIVGGDNGIKMEANGGQQTISGLSNRIWTGKAVSGRAATEDQLQQAVENATATAAQNEQHIQSGNYDVGQGKGLDGKPIGKNSVAINVVSGDGTKPGDVKGQVVINNVAKADELGDVAKLNGTVRNGNGHPTSTVDAINNLDNRVETKVGDNTYSRVKGKEIADGDSATTAIGKLNNRMNDIYTTAGQHSTVSTVDANLTLSKGKNASGGTDYKLGLNKEHIDLGNVTINGNAGSIEADSFTAGDTVVNKDGVKVGDKSALTGDSLKVGGKTYVDDKGINANGKAIGNVAAGSADTDAVNVKQVNDLAARQGEAITENAAHIGELGRAVNKLDNRINRVGAGAAALAALHPGSYDPDDKLDVSAGVGNYRGANAAAVGLFFHPNERTILSVAGSMGGGENMVNAGVTLKVGPGHGTPTTVTTRTGQKVDVMDILAKQTEILEKLAGNAKAVSAPAGSDIFPDVPQNHWAYAYVDKLYRTGSLAGFSEPGKLKSHMLTRKDFAEILYWAMTNGATTNPDLNSDGSLNRLAAEFGAELKLVMK